MLQQYSSNGAIIQRWQNKIDFPLFFPLLHLQTHPTAYDRTHILKRYLKDTLNVILYLIMLTIITIIVVTYLSLLLSQSVLKTELFFFRVCCMCSAHCGSELFVNRMLCLPTHFFYLHNSLTAYSKRTPNLQRFQNSC